MRAPLQRVHTCASCGPGITHLIDPSIYPNDVDAKKVKDGWKCGNCFERDIADMIVRSSPQSTRAKEIIAEDRRKVDIWNRYNLKKRKYRYSS